MKLIRRWAIRLADSIVPERTIGRAMVQVRAALDGRRISGGKVHLLVVAPGGGSVGDQAMFESFIAHVKGPTLVIVQSRDSVLEIPAGASGRVNVAQLRLLDSSTLRYLLAVRRLAKLLPMAASLSVIGADMMDGGYDPASSGDDSRSPNSRRARAFPVASWASPGMKALRHRSYG